MHSALPAAMSCFFCFSFSKCYCIGLHGQAHMSANEDGEMTNFVKTSDVVIYLLCDCGNNPMKFRKVVENVCFHVCCKNITFVRLVCDVPVKL